MPKFHVQVTHRQALHWRDLSDALRRIEESDAIPTAKLAIRMLGSICPVQGKAWFTSVTSWSGHQLLKEEFFTNPGGT